MKIKELFEDFRIASIAGEKNSGKTNNLMSLIKEFRETNKDTEIYIYGVDETTINWAKKLGKVFEISSLGQLSDKENVLIILEEFQRLKLNDRRHRDNLNQFIDFIYHKNNWVIFSSPNLREYNSVIGSKVERWVLKSIKLYNLVNGSQLKGVVRNYNGRYKIIKDINMGKDKLLIINDDYEKIIKLDYIGEIDTKKENKNIFEIVKKKSEKSQELG